MSVSGCICVGVGWDGILVGIRQGVRASGGICVEVGCEGGRNRETKEQQA